MPAPCSDQARPTSYREATVALGQPLLGHLDPEFLRILDETSERLRHVFGTANRRTEAMINWGAGPSSDPAAAPGSLRPGSTPGG